MNREETLYKDFSARLRPRLLWHSDSQGTYIRPRKTPRPQYANQLTAAQDNAIGRRIRRRANRLKRGWLPYAKR